MRRVPFAVAVLCVLLAFVVACSRPTAPSPVPPGLKLGSATVAAGTPKPPTAPPAGSGIAATAAAGTSTAAAKTVVPTNAPAATPVVAAASSPAPGSAVVTQVSGCTDRASMIQDVTVPDNTSVTEGQAFVKTWRLRNNGTCAWSTSYKLVFVKGNDLGAPASVPLPAAVAAGATIDVPVSMTAPAEPGTYRGNWQLQNSRGESFGIGTSDGTFWVQIVAAPPVRISLAAGASSISLSPKLAKGVPQGYSLAIQAGQHVTLKSSVDLTPSVLDPGGKQVTIAPPTGKFQWDFDAAAAGDYTLLLHGAGAVTFTVTIATKP